MPTAGGWPMRAQLHTPSPEDERERLRAVRDLDLLEARPEPDLDAMVELTAGICGTPIAVVSVLEGGRHSAKAGVGVDIGAPVRGQPLCAQTIDGHGLLVVPDARADVRFADHPDVVAEPGIRFYAGAPLLTAEGFALGTLCVADAVPRRLGLGQLRALRALARQVTTLLELRHGAAQLARASARRRETERLHDELVPLLAGDLRQPLAEIRRNVEVLRDLEFCPAEVAARLGAAAHAHAPELVRLLDNLLRMSEPTIVERREVDLNALVEWAVREVRPIAEARDIHLRLDAGPSATVPADPRRLAQALAHLMFSAVKFTPATGRIGVRIAGGAAAPTLEVRVLGPADTPATLLPHLVNGTLGAPSATGEDAGLAALKVVLDAHHATVAVCDTPDEGTAFQVAFPPA
jgi:signal transduction histidine kinase